MLNDMRFIACKASRKRTPEIYSGFRSKVILFIKCVRILFPIFLNGLSYEKYTRCSYNLYRFLCCKF